MASPPFERSLRDSGARLDAASRGAQPNARAGAHSAFSSDLARFRELRAQRSGAAPIRARGARPPPLSGPDSDASSLGGGDSADKRGSDSFGGSVARPRGTSAFVEMVAWAEDRIIEANLQAERTSHENEHLRRILESQRSQRAATVPRDGVSVSGTAEAGAAEQARGSRGGGHDSLQTFAAARSGPPVTRRTEPSGFQPSAADAFVSAGREQPPHASGGTPSPPPSAPLLLSATRLGKLSRSADRPRDTGCSSAAEAEEAAAELAAERADRKRAVWSAAVEAAGVGGSVGALRAQDEKRALLARIDSLEHRLAEQQRVSQALERQLADARRAADASETLARSLRRTAGSGAAGGGIANGAGADANGAGLGALGSGGDGVLGFGDGGGSDGSGTTFQVLRLIRLLQERDGEILRLRHDRTLFLERTLANASHPSGVGVPMPAAARGSPPTLPPARARAPISATSLAALRQLTERSALAATSAGGGGPVELRELCSELQLQLSYVLDMVESQTDAFEQLHAKDLAARLRRGGERGTL